MVNNIFHGISPFTAYLEFSDQGFRIFRTQQSVEDANLGTLDSNAVGGMKQERGVLAGQ